MKDDRPDTLDGRRVLVVAYCEPAKPWQSWQLHSLFSSYLDLPSCNFDFLVSIPPGSEDRLDPRIHYRHVDPIHSQYQHPLISARVGFHDGYVYMNHYLALTDLPDGYDYVLATDCDTVLTSRLAYYAPHPFLVGRGRYESEYAHQRLARFCQHHGFHKFGRHRNIHSTWYGKPCLLERCAREVRRVVRLLLEEEDWTDTSWPKWWIGVAVLYAAEIVLNEEIDALSCIPGVLDSRSDSLMDERAIHLHMWHTRYPDRAFCKFSFQAGYYDRHDVSLTGNAKMLYDYARRGRSLARSTSESPA